MKKLKKYIGLCGLALLPIAVQAQTITFETEDYAALGVYDTWEASPFRTGELSGNVAVVDNHLKTADGNNSDKILGMQRSRFGSNTFGVKIDLKETFELTPTQRYAHVMIYKPREGRVMLIGLGKRSNRADQSNDVEQFWSFPVSDVKVGEWFDAVFPIKGNGGIDIYSLVVVPDCEAPHTLDGDFVAYVDDIVINNEIRPRIGVEDYATNFAKDAAWGRSDRKITGVNFNGGSDGNQSITISESQLKGYMEMFDTPFKAKAGDNITATIGYSSTWMHSYIYIDRGKDGQYSAAVTSEDLLDTTTDLMAYSLYRSGSSGNAHNSAGTSISESDNGFNRLDAPAFTIPSDLAKGIYRMRYKLDWNEIDPGGNVSGDNSILNNGGGIVDVLLNIHEDQVSVSQDNRNGEILMASTGATINNDKVPFGQALKIKMNPSNGFEYNGIRVRHGYNITGDSIVKSTPQYRDEFYYLDQFDSEDCFTIPGSVIDGDVLIEGLFVEEGKGLQRRTVTYNIKLDGRTVATKEYNVMAGSAYPEVSLDCEASSDYYSLSAVPEGTVPNEDVSADIILTQNLPFETSSAIDESTVWYTLTITANKNKIIHDPSLSYIDLTASATGHNTQWAFIGDVINGFKIVNRGAGEGYVLSSSTSVTSSNDGSVYPIMTAEPVASTNNTYWIPTKSTSLSGESNGFYLHQLGFTTHRMNSRNDRLAYWVSGAGAGSTFIATIVDESMPDIDYCDPQPASGRSVSNGKTNRTDRYLTQVVFNDQTTSLTISGGGSTSGRNVVFDRTSSVFNTEPGKVVTVNGTGAGDWVNTFLYVDFDSNGFTYDDLLFGNYQAGVGNHPTVEFTFTVPEGTPSGFYRARYFNDWNNTDPCLYGESGSDNGECVFDFWIKVTAYGNVSFIVNGDGAVEGWTKLDKTTGRPAADAAEVANGSTIATGAKTSVAFIFVPQAERVLTAVVIENGDEAFSMENNSDRFVSLEMPDLTDAYNNATSFVLSPVSGDVTVTATFSEDVQGITDIFGDENDGPLEFYNLQGVKVAAENIVPGIYIVRRGDKTAKVYIR